MPQTPAVSVETYRERIAKAQAAMKEFGLRAMVLESGPAMLYLTGVRWVGNLPPEQFTEFGLLGVNPPAGGELVFTATQAFASQAAFDTLVTGNLTAKFPTSYFGRVQEIVAPRVLKIGFKLDF